MMWNEVGRQSLTTNWEERYKHKHCLACTRNLLVVVCGASHWTTNFQICGQSCGEFVYISFQDNSPSLPYIGAQNYTSFSLRVPTNVMASVPMLLTPSWQMHTQCFHPMCNSFTKGSRENTLFCTCTLFFADWRKGEATNYNAETLQSLMGGCLK